MAVASQERTEHALQVLSSLENMKSREFICDFEIKVENRSFLTHRALLAACSGYFEAAFSSNMREAQEGVITMREVPATAIERCIGYMYTGSCNLTMECVKETLQASNLLQLKSLEEKCFKFLMKNLRPDNCLFVLNLARIFCNHDLEDSAEAVILKNMKTVVLSDLFMELRKDDLLRYISGADCATSWLAVTTWSKDREKEFEDLAERIDFSKFPFEVLLREVVNNKMIDSSNKIKSMVQRSLFSDSKKLKRNLNSTNCFKLKKLATNSDSKALINSFMQKEFSTIISEPQFCDLSKDELILLLKSSEVNSEESKWFAILRWTKQDIQNRKNAFSELFGSITLRKLSLKFLQEIVRNETLVRKSNPCMNALMDAIIGYLNPQNDVSEEGNSSEASGNQRYVHYLQQPPGGKVEGIRIYSPQYAFTFESGSFQGLQYEKRRFEYYLPSEMEGRIKKAFSQRQLFKLKYEAGSDVGEIVVGDIPLDTKFSPYGLPDEYQKYVQALDCELRKKGF